MITLSQARGQNGSRPRVRFRRLAGRTNGGSRSAAGRFWLLQFVRVRLNDDFRTDASPCHDVHFPAFGLLASKPNDCLEKLQPPGQHCRPSRLDDCGSVRRPCSSLFLVSGSVKAVEDINRTDDTLAELSQYIAEGHASIRALVATPGSSTDAALAHFEKAVEARLTRLRSLNNLVERRSGVIIWTRGFHESINVQRLEERTACLRDRRGKSCRPQGSRAACGCSISTRGS